MIRIRIESQIELADKLSPFSAITVLVAETGDYSCRKRKYGTATTLPKMATIFEDHYSYRFFSVTITAIIVAKNGV